MRLTNSTDDANDGLSIGHVQVKMCQQVRVWIPRLSRWLGGQPKVEGITWGGFAT